MHSGQKLSLYAKGKLAMPAEPLRGGNARVRLRLQVRIADFEQLGLLLARLESLSGVESARRA